ncbi:hypothetical protein EAN04_24460 [Salmonella enterica]|nr:hypothetical protein [Salmonella enterica]
MPAANFFTPRISVRLHKVIQRKAGAAAGLVVSERYAESDNMIDLTPFLGDNSSVNVVKSIGDAAGAFSLTFADRPNVQGRIVSGATPPDLAIETIYGLVEPNDLIEIRMWNGSGPLPNQLPIKMRGFVTEIIRNKVMQNGRPVRTVVISGQDYGKLLQSIQISYFPGFINTSMLLSNKFANRFTTAGEQRESIRNVLTIGELVENFCELVINPHLEKMLPEYSAMPRKVIPDIQGALGNVSLNYENESGNVWGLMERFLDLNLFNELFIEDREDGVYLVLRPRHYIDLASGEPLQQLTKAPVFVDVKDSLITRISSRRTDQEIYNWIWLINPLFNQLSDNYVQDAAYLSGIDGDITWYQNVDQKYFGPRLMQVETQVGPPDVDYLGTGLLKNEQEERDDRNKAWISSRQAIAINSVKDNLVLENGSMEMKGGINRYQSNYMDMRAEHFKVGDYLKIFEGTVFWTAYVKRIEDNFVPLVGYTSRVDYERGSGFAMRVNHDKPYLAEMASAVTTNQDRLILGQKDFGAMSDKTLAENKATVENAGRK